MTTTKYDMITNNKQGHNNNVNNNSSLVFSPQTHKLCSQEILKVTENLKEYKQILKVLHEYI